MALSKVKPKRIYCFICGNVKENEGEKFSLFGVPKDKLEEWRVAISSNQLKKTSKLCDAHFSGEDIIKGSIIGGQLYLNDKYWRLRKNAIPKLFISTISQCLECFHYK